MKNSIDKSKTDQTSDLEEKCLFSTGVLIDQVSQYSTMMTNKLTTGKYRKIDTSKPPCSEYKTMLDWIKNFDFDNSEDGYFFNVVVEPPSDLTSASARSVELFNPVLVKVAPTIEELSPYQLLMNREASIRKNKKDVDKGENYKSFKKVVLNISTMSRYEPIKENLFGPLLQYVINELDFKLISIISLHTFKQENWLKKYITENQERRKSFIKNGDDVGSNSEKLKNNTCFGGHGCSSKRPLIRLIYNYREEAVNFTKLNADIDHMNNPWLLNENHIKQVYNEQFKEEKAKLYEKLEMDLINTDQYNDAKELLKEKLVQRRDDHTTRVSKMHVRRKKVDVKDVVDEYMNSNSFKDIYYNNSKDSSIKAIVSVNQKSVEFNGRAISSMILQYAKQWISIPLTRIIKLFHHTTKPPDVDSFMKKYEIEEIHVYLGATDTDSAKLQIVAVANRKTSLTSKVYAVQLRRLICENLRDILDLSDEYFEKFGLRDQSTQKKLGTFCFDEIEKDVTTVRPGNQLKYAVYLGPKKYYETSFSEGVKMKHAGTSSKNKQVCANDYIGELQSFKTNFVKMLDFNLMKHFNIENQELIKNPLKVRKVIQNILKRDKNGTKLMESMKVVFSGVPYKRYMMGDGITTLPFGHPLLEKYIYTHNNIEYDNSDYHQDDLLLKKIDAEQKIYTEHRPLYVQHQLFETGRLEDYDKNKMNFLQIVTDSKFS